MSGDIPFALFITGLVFTIGAAIVGLWVGDMSYYWRRPWHIPTVVALGVIAAALFIAAAWVEVLV